MKIMNKKWREREIVDLTKKLAYLLSAGIPLLDGLVIVADQFRGQRSKQIHQIRDHIVSGVSLKDAFNASLFPFHFILLLGLAQFHGKLADTFSTIGNWYERKLNFRDQMIRKISYPLFLLVFVFLLLLYFLFFLLPQFKDLLVGFNIELPKLTKWVLDFQIFIENNYIKIFISFIIVFISICLLIYLLYKNDKLIYILLKVPYAGNIIRFYLTQFFTSQLGLLLDAGMGIREALQEMRRISHNKELAQYLLHIEDHILLGKPLSKINIGVPIFHKEFYRFIALGEQLGTLSSQLILCSSLMEERIESRIQFLLKWSEPLFLLILGSIIAFIILSIFLPLTQLIQSI